MLRDIRYALRRLLAAPGFAAVVLLTVALGVGANTAIFSVVNAMLLRPLPYADGDRLVAVWQDHRALGRDKPEWQTPPDLLDLRRDNRTFDGIVALQGWGVTLTGDGDPQRVNAASVSHDYFQLLGVPPAQGRSFEAAEDVPNGPPVVIVSHGFWQQQLGGRPDVLGSTLVLNDAPWTIVGVLPAAYRDPIAPSSIYRPLPLAADGPCGRGCYTLRAIGRLKPGVTFDRARSDVAGIMRRNAALYPENKDVGAWLVPLREQLVGDVRPALLTLLGAVTFVLLIACVNVANLLIARTTGRSREVAVRTALGAGRERLVRQLLTESLVLAAIGGALGLMLGTWGTRLVVARLPDGMGAFYQIAVDGKVAAFTVALSALSALIFGLGPALMAARGGIAGLLRASGRAASGGVVARRVRDALIVGEVALALVLLAGAGLMMRSFVARQRVEPGFQPEHVLLAGVTLPQARYQNGAAATAAYFDQLVARVARDPRVQSVGISTATPLQGGDGDIGFQVEGRANERNTGTWVRFVSPDYLRTMGMRVVAGRGITAGDRAGAPTVALISETFAKRYWPGERAVGKRIVADGFPRADSVQGPITIVGVVNDVRFDALDAPPKVELYVPVAQAPRRAATLAVRTTADAAAIAPLVRREVVALDRTIPVGTMEAMTDRMRESLAMPRLYASLFLLFAGAALALAAIGIYGVIAYAVERRTKELGVRLALGARPDDVRRLVVTQGMAPVLAGVGVGLVGAFGAARTLRSLLFGVGAADPLTFGAVTLFLVGIALLAAYLPARRATRVSPTQALQAE